jgi:hypothetical protein
MIQVPCDAVQEYEVPSGVTAIRIEAETTAAGRHSSSAVTLQMVPGAILRLRFACLPGPVDDASKL